MRSALATRQSMPRRPSAGGTANAAVHAALWPVFGEYERIDTNAAARVREEPI